MTTMQLFNLDVGDELWLLGKTQFVIGPFHITLRDNYGEARSQMFQPEHLHVQLSGPINLLERSVTRIDGKEGGWVVSATLTYDETNADTSLLARTPMQDGGIKDLCEILTFVTGRRVVVDGMQHFFNPNARTDGACLPAEALIAANLAWTRRQLFHDHKLVYALLLENGAIDYQMMQLRAYLHNVVLNILVDHWPSSEISISIPSTPPVSKQTRSTLADAVEAAVRNTENLLDETKNSYIPILRGKVMQGPASMQDAVMQFLKYGLGILPLDAGEDIVRRVKFMNRVRNHMTHSGQMPELQGLEQEVADRYTAAIVGGVVPEINQLALGRLFGFRQDSMGSRSQDGSDLRRFFIEGNWRGQPLELMSFDEWINSPELLI